MDLGTLVLQNLFNICSSVVAAVVGYLVLRVLRGVRASTERTEKHTEETAQKLGALDTVSLTGSSRELEKWQAEMALRVEAIADGKSDTLAWQATFDRTLAATIRRVAALEQFALDLDGFAHGGPVPTFTAAIPTTNTTTTITEEPE